MTITFTDSEWEQFTGELSKWRFCRDIKLVELLQERLENGDVQEVAGAMGKHLKDNPMPSPIRGMKMPV